jgi:hypothetical protein
MSLLVGAVIAQGALGAIQTGVGIAKAKAATRPEYMLPTAIEEQMTDAQRMSYYGLPEEQKREFLDNIARSTAGQVRGLSDRRSGVGAVQAAAQGERDAYKSLLSADSAARMANIDRLQNVRSAYAQYEDRAFALNELEPYMQEVNAAAALQGAGLQNIGGALNTLALSDMYGVLGGEKKGVVDDVVETMTTPSVNPLSQTPLNNVSGQAASVTDLTMEQILGRLRSTPSQVNSTFQSPFDILSTMGSIGGL